MRKTRTKAEKLHFRSYDGYKLEGSYVKPQNDLRGAILFVHGIMSDRDDLGFHSGMAEFLAQKGIASLRFDYRFHGKYESSLEDLTLGGIINDIQAAFDALKQKTGGLTSNYFVVATSFGGGVSAYWVDLFAKGEIKKVILNAPVIDYEDDMLVRPGLMVNGALKDGVVTNLNSKGYIKSGAIRFGRGIINEIKYVNGISALKNLGDKVCIFHGADDDDVPLSSSEKFKSAKTKLVVIPKVGHVFGVKNDKDLTNPETKVVHQGIYEDVWSIFEKEI